VNKPECKAYPNGDKEWYLNGELHREDGPAVELADGYKAWHLNGYLHREDSHAIELVNGDKAWYLNGNRHREDGPAIELVNGRKEWWLNGEEVNPETIVDLWLAKNIYCIYNKETNELEFE
jgi:hypothetical protein